MDGNMILLHSRVCRCKKRGRCVSEDELCKADERQGGTSTGLLTRSHFVEIVVVSSNPHMFSLSSNCARARLISSCVNNNSSSRASFFASAGLREYDEGHRSADAIFWTDQRLVGTTYEVVSQMFEVRKMGSGNTYNICDVFYQDFFHYIHGVVCWIMIIAESVHKTPH